MNSRPRQRHQSNNEGTPRPVCSGSTGLLLARMLRWRWFPFLAGALLVAIASASTRETGGVVAQPGCLFHDQTGLPCPTCGLMRSVAACFRLEPVEALSFHLFGPPLVLLLLGSFALAAFPNAREWVAARLCHRQRTCAIGVAAASLSFLVYCAARAAWVWAGHASPW